MSRRPRFFTGLLLCFWFSAIASAEVPSSSARAISIVKNYRGKAGLTIQSVLQGATDTIDKAFYGELRSKLVWKAHPKGQNKFLVEVFQCDRHTGQRSNNVRGEPLKATPFEVEVRTGSVLPMNEDAAAAIRQDR